MATCLEIPGPRTDNPHRCRPYLHPYLVVAPCNSAVIDSAACPINKIMMSMSVARPLLQTWVPTARLARSAPIARAPRAAAKPWTPDADNADVGVWGECGELALDARIWRLMLSRSAARPGCRCPSRSSSSPRSAPPRRLGARTWRQRTGSAPLLAGARWCASCSRCSLPGDSRGLKEVGAPHRHAIAVRRGERPDLEIGATVPPDWSDRTVDLLVDELPGGVQSLRQ